MHRCTPRRDSAALAALLAILTAARVSAQAPAVATAAPAPVAAEAPAVATAAPAPVAAQAPAEAQAPAAPVTVAAGFTLEQVRSYPFPTGLTASRTGSRIAWAFNENGKRNIWVAEGPDFTARRLTGHESDDGQELSSISLTPDGSRVVYIRGGDHGSNWDEASPVNPLSLPVPPDVGMWSIAFAGGAPVSLGPGSDPVVSPRGDVVAFEKDRQIWTVPVDGSAPARRLFQARGSNGSPRWSPDGSRIAFVSDRDDHSWIGIFTDSLTPITWIAPTTGRDEVPAWSPDGTHIAFVRRPGAGGAPDSILTRRPTPWAIWTADTRTGEARELYRSPETLRGSVPSTHGGYNLHWMAGRIAFLSYSDGWPHLYSIPETGGAPLLLTPGDYMAEHIRPSPDGRFLVFAANTGSDKEDIDRRHVVMVPVDRAAPRVLTPGTGLEWSPAVLGDGRSIALVSATAQRPPLPAAIPIGGGAPKLIGADRIPTDFPVDRLVVPRSVSFRAPDGMLVHGQLFDAGGSGRRAAIVYVHGGPPRQMLVGWNYSDYYSNAYALNQYLASRGYVVLAVNYRQGIGYGFDFHQPPNAGARGASEYQDVLAAGKWLQSLAQVDPERIGVYGGSWGGYLTALALARSSDVFAAGVDYHGVHDLTMTRAEGYLARDRFERAPDAEHALEVAFRSSPVADIATWRSPVLLVHGDDDRNVGFDQTVDLVRRLTAAGVPFEQIVIPDDTHHFLRNANWLRAGRATADFFDRKLR